MADIIKSIERNYNPVWEGQTKGGISKKIYAIIGPIQEITYRRLIDRDGVYLNDVNNNQLLVIKKYRIKNENFE